jgi:hypothetical protein
MVAGYYEARGLDQHGRVMETDMADLLLDI